MTRKLSNAVAEIPHTWDFEHWPPHVYPHSAHRAKYLARAFRDDLIREGVMTRVGRELVFFGARYDRWLQKRRADVPGYTNGCVATKEAVA